MHTLNVPSLEEGVEIFATSIPSPFTFRAKMAIDADGSPSAYNPANTGLDHIGNAGRPGNWWAIVTDNGRQNGVPVVQTSSDPYPGYYISMTALTDPGISNPRSPQKYVDSEKIPYVVLPAGGSGGARLGDFATVVHLASGKVVHAIYADVGPRGEYGEGSMALASSLGIPSSPRKGGTSKRVLAYVFYPLSGNGTPRSAETIQSEGERLFHEWGGIDRIREVHGNAAGASLAVAALGGFSADTLDGKIAAAEESLDLEALRGMREALLENSVSVQADGQMVPSMEVIPSVTLMAALGLETSVSALDVSGWLGAVNKVVHAERWVRFVLDKAARPHLPVVVAEGDSWFLHPLIHETLDHLREEHYNVRSLAAAGDTVENMLGDDQWLKPVAEEGAHAFLFSGGGNDFLGGGNIDRLVRPEDPGKHPVQLVISTEVNRLLDRIGEYYVRMLRRLRGDRPWVRVFAHGYDHVVKVDKGPWIWPYLEAKGYSRERAVAVTAVLLDRFNLKMEEIETKEENFRFIRMVGTVGSDVAEWDDAIHPKSEGFRKVALRFHHEIAEFLRSSAASSGLEFAALEAAAIPPSDSYDPLPDINEDSELDGTPFIALATIPRIDYGDVSWVGSHLNHPDYAHLPEAATGASFELNPKLLDKAVSLGFYSPHFTATGHLIVAIRGASLGSRENHVLGEKSVSVVEQKPDHQNHRCLIAVWHSDKGTLSVFKGSTVPNRGGVASACNRYNGYGGVNANLLPTGCYELCVGTHYGSHEIPTILRLGTGPSTSDALEVTTLRTMNDGIYGTRDFWDRCRPANNVHPAFNASTADFSSLGCLTVPGSYSRGTHNGLWEKFRHAAGFDDSQHTGTRYNLLLTTGMELAAISLGGHDLRRLSHGSVGVEVEKLQKALGLPADANFGPGTKKKLVETEAAERSGTTTGIYTLPTQHMLGFQIF